MVREKENFVFLGRCFFKRNIFRFRCGHCKQLAPIYDQLGDHFKDSDSVVIAKIDATANELEHTKVTSYPTIKLYKKEDKENPIQYEGERTLEELTNFMESRGASEGPEVKKAHNFCCPRF